ncbi:MAG TPA: ATP synthase subunit I [Candidatus Pseudogracilibacillus intestinigallinarum]|uniref:ATP synthase subunit I n=1 Tax=Candidatus Pseudogracilibacillus intestinigallinarum TaxID=2838742 RepID=A0A9D1TJZ4_9BACI|nr:ATP synthase subunit I [Candidatus Pseudogracilibacillus intestinigallinarum]
MPEEYRIVARRQRKWMYLFFCIIIIMTLFLPYEYFLNGLLLGAVISFYNLWLLQRRTDLLGESAEKYGKRKGIGTISRLASAALGTLLAIRFDVSIVGFVIGLMIAYPIIIIDFLLFNRK